MNKGQYVGVDIAFAQLGAAIARTAYLILKACESIPFPLALESTSIIGFLNTNSTKAPW